VKEAQPQGIEQRKYGKDKHPDDPGSYEKEFYPVLFNHVISSLKGEEGPIAEPSSAIDNRSSCYGL
jgi:hypothetical protein